MNFEKISMDRPEPANPNYMGDEERLANERELEVVDVKPEVLKYNTPVLLSGGWATTPETNSAVINGLAGKDNDERGGATCHIC